MNNRVVQCYDVHKFSGAYWKNEPFGTWGLDQFLLAESDLGKGLGSSFIKQFTNERLQRPDISKVVADPRLDNLRAIRAYEKALFQKGGVMETSSESLQLMVRIPTLNRRIKFTAAAV